ncbi:hypothetical protein KV102_11710 [Mumia sp. zg.B53]|uniref:hypothetical protein n=1 Tax=unclassified Mumia TaxID=2621872 RepID=UPI001C6EA7FF|nr:MULTISPECIES: hypothetical protein [unclassified Mumia]MBW9206771.1 hypothetical protein [Mumia sp. zg.B17]MBW9210941.1 hypothetical protein [Mumia sp. zg.B21]MBW9215507.1 hypothetical protein [Mumia sp. zg.B53]MDD9347287.1 hypothetical protein [Mumia sp.]
MESQARENVQAFISACEHRRIPTEDVYNRVASTQGRLMTYTTSRKPVTAGWILPARPPVEDATHALVLPVGLIYGATTVRRRLGRSQKGTGALAWVMLDVWWRPSSPHDHGLTEAMYDFVTGWDRVGVR